MDVRQLRYFVAVAEELNFTRAADRLGIQQPPLSRQIRQLEQQLGVQLLRRLTRGVVLTDSGALLLESAREVLTQIEEIKATVRGCALGESGRIQVGFAGATYFQPLIPKIVRTYRERFPGVSVSPVQGSTQTLLDALQKREIDLAFVRSPEASQKELRVEEVIGESAIAVMPSSHPLASARSVSLASLAGESFIMVPRAVDPVLHASFHVACERLGFRPKLGEEAPYHGSVAPMVLSGFGIGIVPEAAQHMQDKGIAYRSFGNAPPRTLISIAYRRDNRSAAVRNFIALTRRHKPAAE